MTGTTKHVMRMVLLALLFQFICPVFLTTTVQGSPSSEHQQDADNIHVHHNSIILPLLLKEKDETEVETLDFSVSFVALIDFSRQSSLLSEFHKTKLIPFVYHDHIDHHPPLFTLYSVYLI